MHYGADKKNGLPVRSEAGVACIQMGAIQEMGLLCYNYCYIINKARRIHDVHTVIAKVTNKLHRLNE